jgi:hypothetical protein
MKRAALGPPIWLERGDAAYFRCLLTSAVISNIET